MVLLSCSGCSWFAGGADYQYEYKNPKTGAETKVAVHSTREVKGQVTVNISPDGNVTIVTGALAPGHDNIGKALDAMGTLAETAKGLAVQ